MKIVVIDIAASKGGALSILKDFYKYIRVEGNKHQWYFLLSDNYIEETSNIEVDIFPAIKKSRIKKLIFDFISGKNIINNYNPDLVISLQNTVVNDISVPQILYVHQPIPFQNVVKFSLLKKNELSLAIYQYFIGEIIKKSIKKSNKVIVQTKWMKDAIIDKTKINNNKICIIPPTVDSSLCEENKEEWNEKSFFYPTADIIYKNIKILDDASKIIMKNSKHLPNIKVTINRSEKYSDGINCIGRINRDEVFTEYKKSTLVFPSYIETFGLPLLEARRSGTVIVASDCPFSREILEGYENAYFFNPFDSKELANLMLKIMNKEITKKDIKENLIYKENSWKYIMDIIEEFSC